jgi:hypothetical protein
VKPLQSVAMGLVIVALGAKVDGYDLLPDPLGWVLVVRGVTQLPRPLPWRDTLVLLAGLALVVSVPLWFPAVVDTLADTDDSLVWAANLPQVGFTATICAALARPATDAGDTRAASWLKTASTLAIAAGALPIVVYAVEPELLIPLLLLALLTIVLVIVLLFRYAARSWALPEPAHAET